MSRVSAPGAAAGNTIQRNLAPGTTSGLAWGPSQARRAVVVSGVQNGRITLSPTSPVVDGIGIVVAQGDPPFLLTDTLYG